MLKRYLIVLIFPTLLLSVFTFSQESKIDSLQHIIAIKKDTSVVWAYHDLAKLYMSDSTKYAINLLNKGLDYSFKINYPYGAAWLYEKLGIIQDIKGNTDSALFYYDKGTDALTSANAKPSDFVYMIINKGVAYYYAGDMGKALSYYLEAEKICADNELKELHASVLNNLGVVYRHLDDYDSAIGIYEKSITIKKELKDQDGLANSMLNIGLAYGHKNNYEQALNFLYEAREIYRKIGSNAEAEAVNIPIGTTYYELKEYDKALVLLEETLKSKSLSVPIHDMLQAKLTLGMIYKAKEDYENAKKWLLEVDSEVHPTGLTILKKDTYGALAEVYTQQNQFEEANTYLVKHTILKDSLNLSAKKQLEQELAAKYKSDLQEEKIALQDLKILKDKREKIALFLSIGALILILGLLYRLFRIRQKASKKLREQKTIIESSLKEKETLLKEIHHRVKNNLQIISSLLSIQSRHIKDEKALQAIEEGKNRVHSMALIHQNLYQDNDLVQIDIEDYINKLAKSLLKNYEVNGTHIDIKTNIEKLKLDVDTVIPIGLILNELITNSLKYAFANSEKGEINISLHLKNQNLELKVEDNGIGLPNNFNDKKESLGYSLIQAFVTKLKATLKIDGEKGTSVKLSIPNPKLTYNE